MPHKLMSEIILSETLSFVTKDITVEPRLTVTSVIQSSRFYGHIFLAWQNGHTISYKKPSLIRSPINTANGHILNSQTVIDFTPLIRPLTLNLETKMPVTCQFH